MRLSWKLAVSNLQRNRKTAIPFALTSALSVMMLYLVISLRTNPSLVQIHGGWYVEFMMGFGQVIIVLFMAIFLFYTNSFLMKQRKKEFGLFNILGMSKKDVALVLFNELLICWAASLALGIGLGILLDKGMFLLIGRLMNVEVPLEFGISLAAVLQTVLFSGAIYLLLAAYGFLMVNVTSPIELLHADAQGEKQPRARWALAAAGLLCLGAGYWLAISVANPMDAFIWFFIAVILVIIGTYLLFAAGSIALLNILQRNRRFYYQTSHFISVSGMKYRMKANAASLANICILSTMVLVALSTTICLMTGMDRSVEQMYPRQAVLSIYSQGGDQLQEFSQATADAGVQAENVIAYCQLYSGGAREGDTLTLSGDYNPDSRLYTFMSVADYNNAEGTSLQLEPGQILVKDETGNWKEGSMTIQDQSWQIAGSVDDYPSGGQNIGAMGSVVQVVVPDQADMERILATLPEGQNSLTNIYGFDSPQPAADAAAVADAFEQLTGARPFGGDRDSYQDEIQSLYGGLLFIGIFVSILFTVASVLIMYYKQISEGYEDQRRFEIMTRVGLDNSDVKRTIRFQVLAVFFLPLVMAGIHIVFAFPMISKLLLLVGMADTNLFVMTCAIVFAIFAILYVIVYGLTSRAYYQIVHAAWRTQD